MSLLLGGGGGCGAGGGATCINASMLDNCKIDIDLRNHQLHSIGRFVFVFHSIN